MLLCTHAMLGQDLDSVLNQAIMAEDEFSIITRSGAATSLRSNAQGGNSTGFYKGSTRVLYGVLRLLEGR